MRILFELELDQSGEGKEILLSPRIDPDWIPQMPGLRFRQLTYDEEKLGAEYYECSFQTHRGYVEVQLKKGNYCTKVGPRYEFRKADGTWKAKGIGAVVSHGSGTCIGCKAGSGRLYSVESSPQPTPPAKQERLVLTGNLSDVICGRSENGYIQCDASLNLEFANRDSGPLIILQPSGEYSFWHGGTSLALTRAESEAHEFVYNRVGWPSFYHSPVYRQLAEQLDQPSPPAEVTRIIPPGNSWFWNTTVSFSFAAENTCDGVGGSRIGAVIGWREIEKLSMPLWMRVSYEIWPFNVENFKRDLGGKLRKRWKDHGDLYLEEKSQQYWSAHITSEPIQLDLRQVQLK